MVKTRLFPCVNKSKRHFITTKEAKRNKDILDNSYILSKKVVNIVLGSALVGVGILTFPLPTGSILLIMGGLFVYHSPLSVKKLFIVGKRNIYERWLLW